MMRRFMWFLVGLVLSAGPMLAFADTYTAPWGAAYSVYFDVGKWINDNGQGPYDTADAACISRGYPGAHSSWAIQGVVMQRRNCRNALGNAISVFAQQDRRCKFGGTLNTSTGVCEGAPVCPAGQQRNPSTGECQVPPCTSGTVHSSGYYDLGTDDNARMVIYACANGCEVLFDGQYPVGRAIIGGVYHYFARGDYQQNGTTCTSGPSALSNMTAMPSTTCGANQYSGQVNGKDVCIDKATGGETNPYAPKPTPETTEEKTTTSNPDGSTTTITETCTGDNACTTVTQTCTVAGACTSTTTSTGGGAGGGSGTGSGTGKDPDGDGVPDYDSEGNPVDPQKDDADQCQKTPNAAMCQEKVKVDELDTADNYAYTDEKTGVNQGYDDWLSLINGRSWERMDLGFVWSPPVPSGSCAGVSVFGETIPICEPLEKAREWWAWCIYVFAGLAIWIRGTRATAGV